MLSSTLSKAPLVSVLPQRSIFHWYKQRKNDIYPTYFDNVIRRVKNPKRGKVKHKTDDPLFFDYDHKFIN